MDNPTMPDSHPNSHTINPNNSNTSYSDAMRMTLSTPDSYRSKPPNTSSSNDTVIRNGANTLKRRPGRPRGSSTKNKNTDADSVSTKSPKRSVGRPKRDALFASGDGSNGSSTKRQRVSYSQGQGRSNDQSNHKGRLRARDRGNWSLELARTRPDRLLSELIRELDTNTVVTRDTSGMSVKEAFEYHIRSLSSLGSQRIPKLYSILKTFWLPSSPGYFSFAASSSSAGPPLSTHKFFYWDPHLLVFNGIPCPGCGMALHNAGPIRRGPLRILDIGEEGFYVIGAEYVCQSGLVSCEGQRTYVSTDPSILRVLPVKLREEFPVRMVSTEGLDTDSEQENEDNEDIWSWNPPATSTSVPPAQGLSRTLWSLVLGCLRAGPGLGNEAIVKLVKDMWQGRDLEKELVPEGGRESDEESAQDQNASSFEDAYRDPWAANTAANATSDASVAQYPSHSHSTNSNPISHSHSLSNSSSTSFRFMSHDYPSTGADSTGTTSSSTPSSSGSTLTPVMTHSTAATTGTLNGANANGILSHSPLSSSSTSNGVYEYPPSYEQQQQQQQQQQHHHQPQINLPLAQSQTQSQYTLAGNPYSSLNHNHSYSQTHTTLPSHPTHPSMSPPHMQSTHPSLAPTQPPHLNHRWNESTSSSLPLSPTTQPQTSSSTAGQSPFPTHHHQHQNPPQRILQLEPASLASAPTPTPSQHSSEASFPAPTTTTASSLNTGPPNTLTPLSTSPSSGIFLTQVNTSTQKSPPKPRGPRHCTKCRSTSCKGKGGRGYCTNPCTDCGRFECVGRTSRKPGKRCALWVDIGGGSRNMENGNGGAGLA